MKDYRLKNIQDGIVNQFKKEGELPIDICIATHKRQTYLERCVYSIIASTTIPHRIYVIDDFSNDEWQSIWLQNMKARGLIYEVITNKENLGTAKTFNKVINVSTSKVFVMVNDDMFFHRYWDMACLDIYNEFKDCGIVSFYDYTRLNLDEGSENCNNYVKKVVRTGLGASMVNRKVFTMNKGFHLPDHQKMGFLASNFCYAANKQDGRSKHYVTIPSYASHMDLPKSKMNEREFYETTGYNEFRRKHKK